MICSSQTPLELSERECLLYTRCLELLPTVLPRNVVVQVAKLAGCKAIVSVGSDAKADYASSFGVDVAFNYKTASIKEVLEKGPLN